ncbi:hypothetical protein FO519_008263 [Halicephalobus sp. NKZ332]|nr:hypothetical protein FO519_008263 [Halicephalobus sp. NKZ332]
MVAPSEPSKTKKGENLENQENDNAALIEKLKQKGVVSRQVALKNRQTNKKGRKRSHQNSVSKVNKKKLKTPLHTISKPVIDAFYSLTRVTGAADSDPINTIVSAKLNPDEASYVLKRCIAALASGNGAARMSNATVLCCRLGNSKEKISFDDLEKMANEKLPIKDNDPQLKNNVLGREFFYYSLIESGRYSSKEELLTILENLKKYSKFNLNKFIYAEILATVANVLGKAFYSDEFCEVNGIPKDVKDLKDLKPWELMFLLKLKHSPNGNLKKFFENEKFAIKKEDYGKIVEILKSTEHGYDRLSLASEVIAVGLSLKKEKNLFVDIVSAVFDENFKGENSSIEDFNSVLEFLQHMMRKEVVPLNVFPEVCELKKILKKMVKITENRCGKKVISDFFAGVVRYVEEQKPPSGVFIGFVRLLCENGMKDIDGKIKTQWMKKIIGSGTQDAIVELSKYVIENKNGYLSDQIISAQMERNFKISSETWIDLIKISKRSEKKKLFNKAINVGIFTTRRKKVLTFMNDNADVVIKKFAKKYGNKKLEFKEKSNICMQRVYGVIKILEGLIDDDFYRETSKELEERLKNDDFDTEVITDLTLSFISRKETTLKYLSYTMVNEFANEFTVEDFEIFLPQNFVVAARRALGKAAIDGDDDDDIEMDEDELAEMDKRLADVFQVFTSHGRKMKKFQIARFRMDVAELIGLVLLKAEEKQFSKFIGIFDELVKEMSNSIPPEVLAVLNEFNEGLKQLKNAVKEFTSVPFEELQTHPPLAQAEMNSAAMYAVNGLTAINMELQGKSPEEDNDLELEIKRQKRLAERINVARDMSLKPKLNQFAAAAFIRNALFDVRVMAQIQKNPGFFPFKRPLPFDPYLVPDYFPKFPEGDDNTVTQAILTRNNALMPTATEQTAINQMVTKVSQILESIINNSKKIPNIEIQEVKEVGSYKKGTMLTKSNSADLVVILKTLPTVELVMNLGQKVVDELKADLKEIFGCVSRLYGCEIAGTQAIVKLHITIIPPNVPLLEPDLHMPVKTLHENMAMVRHARWFEENGNQSTVKVLVRCLKDIKKRTECWKNLSVWHIELLSHYCIYHTPNRQPLPLSHGFKRFLQVLSTGILLPGSPSLNDPCDRGVPLTVSYNEKDMDSICTGAQTMLRVLCHGGINSIIGGDQKIQDVTTEVSIWDGNVVVTPLEKAYDIDGDEERNGEDE